MKANELMQGDLVLYEYNGEKFHARVVEIYCSSALVESVSKEYEPIEIAEDEIEPIQLGIDVFEKNGFEQTQICQFRNRSINVVVERIEPFQNAFKFKELYHWEVSMGDSYINSISYVHELQRALRLCGIEKEIEL